MGSALTFRVELATLQVTRIWPAEGLVKVAWPMLPPVATVLSMTIGCGDWTTWQAVGTWPFSVVLAESEPWPP